MSSSSATGASSRSPSPATPDASDDLAHVTVQDEDYPWLSSSPVPRPATWDGQPTSYPAAPKAVPSLSLQDLIQESALEDSTSPTESVPALNTFPDGLPNAHPYPLDMNLVNAWGLSQQPAHVASSQPDPALPHSAETSGPQHPIACPPKTICQNLPIILPSIPKGGTKSRVETQIRVVFDLASAEPPFEGADYTRVGSWRWLKLPKGTSTKKRARKAAKIAPADSDVLKLSAEVTCASPPFTPVLSCSTCQAREAKRLARKIAARVRPPRSDSDDGMDEDNRNSKGEDTTSIIQFNCPELLDFATGSTILPLRITCYCRHHREKVGFRVTFTLHDDAGRVVGTGTTPPIMITDDHKTGTTTRKKVNEVALSTSAGQKDKTVLARVRPKPYEISRPASRKASTNASPSSSLPSLPDTRPPTPADFTQSALWLQSIHSVPDWSGLSPPGAPSIPEALLDPAALASTSGMSIGQELGIPETITQEPHIMPTSPSHATISNTATSMVPPLSFFPAGGSTSFLTLPTPVIHRIVPAKGPTSGGTEVTVLGSNFQASTDIKCVFGDIVASSTQRWSDNTLVCIVPARLTPGVVPVWIEGHPISPENVSPPHFTYEDESDRALMELALQVLGLKLTGKVEDAKNVALRIVGNPAVAESNPGVDASNIMQLTGSPQFQATIMKILSVLDIAITGAASLQVADVISLQTSGGQSLLHLAVILGFTNVVDFLLEHGIDIDLRDKNGYTALHFAALIRSASCARRLLCAGADMEIVDARGQTSRDIAPEHFFRGIRISSSHTSSSRVLSEEEAELGDNEDDSDDEGRVRLSKRRVRRKPSMALPERPAQESDQDTVVAPLSPPPSMEVDTKKAVNGPVDEKRSLAAYAELVQRTLVQLSKEKLSLSTVPQMLVPLLPPMPHLPGMPNVPWAQLPQMPVFPVFVPTPAWPAFLDKRSYSSDSGGEQSPDGTPRPASRSGSRTSTSMAAAMKTAQEWLTIWEKIRALSTSASTYPQEVEDSPPPVYTPRAPEAAAETPTTKPVTVEQSAATSEQRTERPAIRPEYPPETPSGQVTAAYEYRPTRKQANQIVHKQDRMLFFFWLPMLFAGFMWACFTAVGVAIQGARTMVEMKTGIRL